ncbi:MAG: 3-phosphoshikimate 1-carboxyvinyltransferase [Bacteroidia bacterium]|nr:3-phosphoshikimate 1-carboxyvinyltransferase [Bacteroidia bacterium]
MNLSIEYKKHGNAKAFIKLPFSKSIANRLLILKHLYAHNLEIKNLPDSNDSLILKNLLENIHSEMNAEDAGTAYRFLVAILAVTEGTFRLSGTERMHERPVKTLVDALKKLGASIEYENKNGFPPLIINGKKIEGGTVTLTNPESSQFISALMMVAPLFHSGIEIKIEGKHPSEPYSKITSELMNQLGFKVIHSGNKIVVDPYIPEKFPEYFSVEQDWSSAVYFYCLSALIPENIILTDLKKETLQGDGKYLNQLPSTETKEGLVIEKSSLNQTMFELDCSNIPDLALPIIVLNSILKIPSFFTGLESLKIKESNRTEAIATELQKLNIRFYEDGKGWRLDPINLKFKENIKFKTYNDHRIAMSLSMFAVLGKIIIEDASVVKKSFPQYWQQLENLNFAIEQQ